LESGFVVLFFFVALCSLIFVVFPSLFQPAASNRSECRQCNEKIAKDAVRVDLYHGQGMDHGPESFGFMHARCFRDAQAKMRTTGRRVWTYRGIGFGVVTRPELHFHGWEELDAASKASVINLWAKALASAPRDSAACMTVEDKQAATRSGKGEEYYAALPRKALQALAKEKGIPATGGNDALRAALVKADEEAAAAKAAAPAPAAAAAAAAAAPASPSAGSKRKLDDVANGSDDAGEDAEEGGKASKVAKTDGATDAATSAAASAASAPAPPAAAAAAAAPAPVVDLKGSRWLLMGGFDVGKGFIQSKLSRAGAEIAPGVSKKVNYVLVGKPVVNEYGAVSGPGSKKHKECKKMKLTCIDEATALQLLKDF
jgi:hypothetical protein